MIKSVIKIFFRVLIAFSHRAYGIEGVNAVLLFMPAKLIVPTLRRYGASIGEGALIHSPIIIHNAKDNYRNLSIGAKAYLGREIFLDLKESIRIGDRATLSMRVTLITHTDVGESAAKIQLPPSSAPITIETDAYLGAGTTVLEGVDIGAGAVVGAASLVNRDVAAKTVVAGNPCREIRRSDA